MNYENNPLMELNIQIKKNAVTIHYQQLAATTVKTNKRRGSVVSPTLPLGNKQSDIQGFCSVEATEQRSRGVTGRPHCHQGAASVPGLDAPAIQGREMG